MHAPCLPARHCSTTMPSDSSSCTPWPCCGMASPAFAVAYAVTSRSFGWALPSTASGFAGWRRTTAGTQPRARPRRRKGLPSQSAPPHRTGPTQPLGSGSRRAEACRRSDQSARCTFWLECRSRQMAVFCAVSANNCSHGAPISLPTSTSTHPRLLRARGRCLGPSTRPYAPQTRLLEEKQ